MPETTNGRIAGEPEIERLVAALSPVVDALNAIPDDAYYSGQTWGAIRKLREACERLTDHKVLRND